MKWFLLLALCGCRGSEWVPPYQVATGGNPDRGKIVIADRQCGGCHSIPHVTGANGRVGPPLAEFALRSFIAGTLPNTPANLITWIENPHAVVPENAMPTLGLTRDEARDVAAFLYTLR